MTAKSQKCSDALGAAPVVGNEIGRAGAGFDPVGSRLIAHIQAAMEFQKAALARELHDELGGLLVGAVMDLAWAEQHLSVPTEDLRQKLVRARQTLATAIDLKRRLIEDLRPTLLDNVGLFAALRWHVQTTCKRAGLSCNLRVPDDERRFLPNIPISLFRIVQEGLAVIVARKPSAPAEFSVTIDGRTLTLQVGSATAAPAAETATEGDVHALATIDQRVASLGGQFEYRYLPAEGPIIIARFPIEGTISP